MKIKSIQLYQYRNHEQLTFTPSEDKNIIVGKNASGKTNILEAIAFALTGNMIRQGTEKDLIQYDRQDASIAIECEEGYQRFTVRVTLFRDKPKQIEINEEKISSFREWEENFPLVIFTPEDLRIAKDGPQYRRRYLNQLLTDIDSRYRQAIASYQRSLLHRNSLLKDGAGKRHFMEQLNSIDAVLIKEGAFIMNLRARMVEKVDELGRSIHRHLSSEGERFSAQYRPDIPCDPSEKESIVRAFVQAMSDNLEKDIAYKSTGRGPHRDDMELQLKGLPLRLFGSQGQQRTAVLTLKLVEANLKKQESDRKPVLLMDDILSELDPERQEYMAKITDDLQMLVTGTENPWSETMVTQWRLHDGALCR